MCVRVLRHHPHTGKERCDVPRERASFRAPVERQKSLTINCVGLKSCGPWAVREQL